MRVTRLLIGVMLISLAASSCLTPPAPNPTPDLTAFVAKAVSELQPVPDTGVAIAIIRDAKVVYSHGFGLRDRATATRVNPHTLFAIGSSTKGFTSMSLSMLGESGLVDLQRPIKEYLPGFKMKDPEASANMTLEDMLSHRTGLPRHDALWYLGPFSQSQLVYRLQYLDPHPNPAFGFRRAFLYNNMIYTATGVLLESVTGGSWQAFVKDRIFKPLGMSKSHFSIHEFGQSSNRAKGYLAEQILPLKDIENIAPAGTIYSNVVEMTRWVLLHLNRGVAPDGTRIISEASLDQMYQSHIPAPEAGPDVGYGLGWFVGGVAGDRLLFHPGNADGYSAYVSFMPDARLGLVLLVSQHHSPFPERLAARIYGHLLGASIRQFPLATRVTTGIGVKIPAQRPPAGKSQAPDAYVGFYANDGYGDVTVRRVGTKLEISYYERYWPLERVDDTVFFFRLEAYGTHFEVPVFFETNPGGAIDAVRIWLEPRVDPIRFAKR